MSSTHERSSSVSVRAKVTCPHCWHTFPPEEILWISAHSELHGDPKLNEDAQLRFLPTRFNVDGNAIDVKGAECHKLACPRCHLSIPRACVEMRPLFISILGTQRSGKSYFLTSMTWQLRRTLQHQFAISFSDADPDANQIVNGYEETLFLSPRDDELAYLPKTQKEGDLYESVKFGERVIQYPKPFVFSLQPTEAHPSRSNQQRISRSLCLYDNAGEHFMPGGESANAPGTQHLALSKALLCLFDPTQHPRFRRACKAKSTDPQLLVDREADRQDLMLLEAANRIKTYSGMSQKSKYSRPLIVVVNKFDAWCGLTKVDQLKIDRVVRPIRTPMCGLDVEAVQSFSHHVRAILLEHAPEFVAAAEGFSDDVTYIPVSPLGRGPEVDEKTGLLMIRPRDIQPMWAEVPMLFALHRVGHGLIPALPRSAGEARGRTPTAGPRPSRPTPPASDGAVELTDKQSARLMKETGS